MSLLIDALKQAEAARAQAQDTATPGAPGEISLEPMREAPASPSPAAHASPITPHPPRPVPRARPAGRVEAPEPSEEARALFEVKHPPPNRLPMILAAASVATLVVGAAYIWWAIQPHGNLIGPELNSRTPPPAASTIALASPTSTQDSSPPPAPANSETDTHPIEARPAANRIAPLNAPPGTREMFRPNRTANQGKSNNRAREEPKAPVSINRSTNTDATGIQSAYATFLEGNYPLARQRYQEVLRQDPRNVDAMNALGLIAWRSGQLDVAERMFRAAAHADPKDVTANAQLALLYSEGDPSTAESRLRSLIASQPSAGAPYYALGSLLARQERWSEAQQILFQAYTLDSGNPDVLFNLAVCLEHLAQPTVARQFYERAVQASTQRPASFDKSIAQSRILKLESR